MNFHKTVSLNQQTSKKVPWSYSRDGLLRSGDQVLITNKKTQGYLVVDISTKTITLEESYLVTTTPQHPGPVTRSIFVIKRAEAVDVFGKDNIIRYGQKIKIEVNPYLHRKPLWLNSQTLTPQCHSPVSRH